MWPETVAVVLWGTDNIKTYGESLAQVRAPPGTSADPQPQSCWRRSMLHASPCLHVQHASPLNRLDLTAAAKASLHTLMQALS